MSGPDQNSVAGGVSIETAESLCRANGLHQVIVLSFDGTTTTVTTFGLTDQDSATAAEAGNRIKRWLGWPEAMCRTESAKVERLHARIAELERALDQVLPGDGNTSVTMRDYMDLQAMYVELTNKHGGQ
ncbi:MAG: hypothetical protein AB1832_00985 [Pseudomonadota bacterium]